MMAALSAAWASGGLHGLWRGAGAATIRVSMGSSVQLGTFSKAKSVIVKYFPVSYFIVTYIYIYIFPHFSFPHFHQISFLISQWLFSPFSLRSSTDSKGSIKPFSWLSYLHWIYFLYGHSRFLASHHLVCFAWPNSSVAFFFNFYLTPVTKIICDSRLDRMMVGLDEQDIIISLLSIIVVFSLFPFSSDLSSIVEGRSFILWHVHPSVRPYF